MNKEIIDSINNIVWIIPIKKIRNAVRNVLFFHVQKKLDIENLIAFSIINETSDNLVIKAISGGVTDQMNHYFRGRYIELKYNRKVKYDITEYGENINGVRNSNRNFELKNLFPNLSLKVATDFEICTYRKLYNVENYNGNTLIENLYKDPSVRIYSYRGWIHSEHVNEISEIIKKELDFDKYVYPLLKGINLDYYNEIKSTDIPIGIHIRRGDWIEHAKIHHKNIPDENYFIKAIELISKKIDIKKAKLFFFSNSMDWVSEHIIPKIKNKYNYVLIDGNDESFGYIDLYLLMSTQHQISSVGGFCRKAHFFNNYKDKLFIVPSETMEPEILKGFTFY